MGILFVPIYLLLVFGLAWFEGRHRSCGFGGALVIALLTSPFLGYFIVMGFAQKNPIGCNWCGNAANEAVICNLCDKDAMGNTRQGYEDDMEKHLISTDD